MINDEDDLKSILIRYSQARKSNGDGLQDLSLHNFIVMRDKTADPKFLLQKKIEQKFSKLHPEKWVPYTVWFLLQTLRIQKHGK